MVIARAGQGRPEEGGEMTPPAADGLHWRRRVKLLVIVRVGRVSEWCGCKLLL